MPTKIVYASLALNFLLTIAGISSVVDDLVRWVSFLGQFVELYQTTIRDPIAHLVQAAVPNSWPKIPRSAIDVLIIWSAFYASFRLFSSLEGTHFRWGGLRENILAYLLGPLFIPYYFLVAQKIRSARNVFQRHRDGADLVASISRSDLISAYEKFHGEQSPEARAKLFVDYVPSPSASDGIVKANIDLAHFRSDMIKLGWYYLFVAASLLLLVFINYQLNL